MVSVLSVIILAGNVRGNGVILLQTHVIATCIGIGASASFTVGIFILRSIVEFFCLLSAAATYQNNYTYQESTT